MSGTVLSQGWGHESEQDSQAAQTELSVDYSLSLYVPIPKQGAIKFTKRDGSFSKMLAVGWKENVKRTVNSVRQTSNTSLIHYHWETMCST